MVKTFTLEAKDILKDWCGSRYGGLRGSTIRLHHAPTKLMVSGDVAMGTYNNKQIKALEAVLIEQLMIDLTKAVAKHLHVAGL